MDHRIIGHRRNSWHRLLCLILLLLFANACSIRKLAINSVASALSELGVSFGRDDDPELVGDALPFALKTIEGLLAQSPENRDLLIAASSGFTQYAYGWVELEAERIELEDYAGAEALRTRALGLYLRARDYGLRTLALSQPDIEARLLSDPENAIDPRLARDVEALFWAGASWGSAISLALDRPEIVVDLPAVRALLEGALAAEPDWQRGLVREAMIGLEALPATMGGSIERAREHFERAQSLSSGQRAGTYLTWASQVAVEQQDRALFIEMLESARAVDLDRLPDERLANRLAQRRARWLLERVDEYFYDDGTTP
jgi:predicted anti-sigma-YlaC factor YlaD